MKTNIKQKMYNKIIKNKNINHVIIFGLQFCPYSLSSINYCKSNLILYKFYKIDKYKNQIIDVLHQLSLDHTSLNINKTHDTFPVIFYNKIFIGGYTELEKYNLKN